MSLETDAMTLVTALKCRRRLSTRVLAEKLNISISTIYYYMDGRRHAHFDFVENVANVLTAEFKVHMESSTCVLDITKDLWKNVAKFIELEVCRQHTTFAAIARKMKADPRSVRYIIQMNNGYFNRIEPLLNALEIKTTFSLNDSLYVMSDDSIEEQIRSKIYDYGIDKLRDNDLKYKCGLSKFLSGADVSIKKIIESFNYIGIRVYCHIGEKIIDIQNIEELITFLKNELSYNGYTQQDIANVLEINRQTVSMMYANKALTFKRIGILCDLLNTPIHYELIDTVN